MKKLVALTVFCIVGAVIIIPMMVVYIVGGPKSTRSGQGVFGEDVTIKVYLHTQDKIVQMGLEDYIKGVVAAEMPAEFEVEALKAQAVAARTYAVKNMVLFGGSGLSSHSGADVSTDPRQGQAWVGREELKERWGLLGYNRYWDKVSQAVEDTRGLIAVYNGEPIHAMFHSTSGERTASAKEVWGTDYPYLQSVPCTWDQKSPRYADVKTYTYTELEARLGPEAGVMTAVQGGSQAVAQIIGRSDSGRVDKARFGGKTFSGVELRQKLDLRSANFTVELDGDKAVFKTVGYGHGVGMCQYGANGMAKEGKNFREILAYYYTGINLKNIFGS
ncbi:MAG: stage sporulation protein [Firmicutes bacterium]|nr:stage sporulation protein [Bacillota bacterium]